MNCQVVTLVTAKVKALLIKDDQMMQAEKIALSVEGVKRVDNSLQVKRAE